MPVLIALFHDILITAGVYSLTGKEVSSGTVAAFLTILGYSLYDTIIVFDRIRENMPRMPRAAFSQIVNRSMSEVLTRSLATSFTTLLAVTSLLIFGGATLQDFAFAMLVGIASGTYSSIFIASPVLTAWKEREPGFARRRAADRRALRDRFRPSPTRSSWPSSATTPRAKRDIAATAEDAPRGAAAGRRRWRPRSRRTATATRRSASSNGEKTAAEEASAERREKERRAPRAAPGASQAREEPLVMEATD